MVLEWLTFKVSVPIYAGPTIITAELHMFSTKFLRLWVIPSYLFDRMTSFKMANEISRNITVLRVIIVDTCTSLVMARGCHKAVICNVCGLVKWGRLIMPLIKMIFDDIIEKYSSKTEMSFIKRAIMEAIRVLFIFIHGGSHVFALLCTLWKGGLHV